MTKSRGIRNCQPIKYNPEFIAAVKSGMPDIEVAKRFGVAHSTVINYRLDMGITHARYNHPGFVPAPKRYYAPRKKLGNPVDCKCPTCGKIHQVKFQNKPKVMPRIFCKEHESLRYEGDYEGYSIGRMR